MVRDARWDRGPAPNVVRGRFTTKLPTKRYDDLLRAEREMAIYMRSIEHVARYQARYIEPLGRDDPRARGWWEHVRAWVRAIQAATEELRCE
jgi:hypothetical protein